MAQDKLVILPRTNASEVKAQVEQLGSSIAKTAKGAADFSEIHAKFFRTFYDAWGISKELVETDFMWVFPFFRYMPPCFEGAKEKINSVSGKFKIGTPTCMWSVYQLSHTAQVIHDPLLEYRPFGVQITPSSIEAEDLFSGEMHKGRHINYPELDGLESRISQKSQAGDPIISCIAVEEAYQSYAHDFPSSHFKSKLFIKESRKSSTAPKVVYVPRWLIPVTSVWTVARQTYSDRYVIFPDGWVTIDWTISLGFETVGALFANSHDGQIFDAMISELYFHQKDKKNMSPALLMNGCIEILTNYNLNYNLQKGILDSHSLHSLISSTPKEPGLFTWISDPAKYSEAKRNYEIEMRGILTVKEAKAILDKIPLKMNYP